MLTDLRPFILNQPVIATTTTDFQLAIDSALARVSPAGGSVADETYIEALLQIATGIGFDGNGDGDFIDSGVAGLVATQISPAAGGDVPDIGTFQPDPTGDPNGPVLPPDGTIGGVGFRANSTQRIVLLGTDGDLNVEDDGMTTYTGVGGVTVPVADFMIGGDAGILWHPGRTRSDDSEHGGSADRQQYQGHRPRWRQRIRRGRRGRGSRRADSVDRTGHLDRRYGLYRRSAVLRHRSQ